MNNIKNALFINFGGIGDEILFLPTLGSFKYKFPNTKITLCLEPRSRSIKELSPLIDDVILIDPKSKNKYFELLKLLLEARKGRFDAVISSGGNKLISILLFLTGAKIKIGFDTGVLSRILLTHAVKLNKNQYAANMYHDLVKPLTNDEPKLPSIKVDKVFKEPNSVVIHPGVSKMSVSKNMVKTYSPQKWTELILALMDTGKTVYLAGGPDDKDYIEDISTALSLSGKNLSRFVNFYGKTKNIMDLAVLINSKETLICCDSAPMHIGVAVGTKVLAIFGPTDEEKLLPKFPNFIAIKNSAPCRPCLWEKRRTTCGVLDCLDIPISEILKNV